MSESRYSVTRITKQFLNSVMWTDDVVVSWGGPTCLCEIYAVLDYVQADVRLILRRGPNELTLGSRLGNKFSFKLLQDLDEGDEVVLQWRTWIPNIFARSNVAEVTIERSFAREQ